MIRILQLTDLHVFAEPNVELKGVATRESLIRVAASIEHSGEEYDAVIVTGDHTHDELPETYAVVGGILAPWRDRLHVVPGNHDERERLRSQFSERVPGTAADPVRFAFDAENWLCLGLDTHLPGEVAGRFDAAQAEWLREQLAQSNCARVALFMHHPPVSVGSIWMDAIGLEDAGGLSHIVADDDRIRLICCGHVHHEFELRLHQARVCSTPSTGLQFEPDSSEPTFDLSAPPGYRVIELDGDNFSTRVVRVPESCPGR